LAEAVIAPSLEPLTVPIDQLRPLEGNPRRGEIAAIRRSLRRFGQRKPVVAWQDGTIQAGNHTLVAAVEEGWDRLAVVFVEEDKATGKAYAVADNRTSALGTFNLGDLATMVAEVQAIDPDLLEAASYTVEQANALFEQASPSPPDAFPEVDEDLPTEHRCPQCGYEWSGKSA
jgi:hypothetical protein